MLPDALHAAFPRRPLRIAAPLPHWRNLLVAFGMTAIVAGFGWLAATSILPALLADYAIRNRAVPVMGRLENGRCSVRLGLLQSCELTLVSGVPGKGAGVVRQRVDYLFVEPHLGTREVTLMGDPAQPGRLSTDLGLDHLTSRTLTLIGMGIALAALQAGAVLVVLSGARARRAMQALSERELTPVPLRLAKGKEGWQVWPLDGRVATAWPLPAKAEPFWLDPAAGVALGVTAPGGALFPLDRDLGWIDLAPEEREGLRAARGEGAGGLTAPLALAPA